jgi:hypothetical protein
MYGIRLIELHLDVIRGWRLTHNGTPKALVPEDWIEIVIEKDGKR